MKKNVRLTPVQKHIIESLYNTRQFNHHYIIMSPQKELVKMIAVNHQTNTIQEFERRTVESLLKKKVILISDFDKTYENKAIRYKVQIDWSVIL